MTIDVTTTISNLISEILNDRDVAQDYAADPSGVLAARGLTDADLSEVDIPEVAGRVAAEHGQTDPYAADQTAVSPPSYDGEQGVGEVIQHLNYITYVNYEDDRDVIQNIEVDNSRVDSSVDIDVDNSHYHQETPPPVHEEYDGDFGGGAKPAIPEQPTGYEPPVEHPPVAGDPYQPEEQAPYQPEHEPEPQAYGDCADEPEPDDHAAAGWAGVS
ncbi:hypothetical protein [Actinoplanes sp. G11-F43]|uniref:hypothetical protein n=1 Tax=Actinoplanes sp. G11-F43 TaxID=3424130 RepID=UPI003D35757A